jgi:cytidine deaminase
MKKKSLNLEFFEANDLTELEKDEQKLVNQAIDASHKAYAPYSDFKVGAAVLLENGEIISGNNQENAAYPSSLCAERVALFAAAAKYPGVAVRKIAITSQSIKGTQEPITPCGACRQVMIEYEHLSQKPVKVIMHGQKGSILISSSVEQLMPLSFDGTHLKK